MSPASWASSIVMPPVYRGRPVPARPARSELSLRAQRSNLVPIGPRLLRRVPAPRNDNWDTPEDTMKRSTDRILTTHVGSLPRPDDLRALILKKQQGEAVDEAAFAARVKGAVGEVVKRQAEAGIDIVADGEMGRIGFIPYVNERLAGITPSAAALPANYWGTSREYQSFPEFYAWAAGMPGTAGQTGRTRSVCTGPAPYKGAAALGAD